MRIALLGQAAFAEKALAALVDHGDEIVHVFAPPDPPAGKPDALAAKARAMGLPLSQPKSFKNDAAFEQFKALDADLAILAFVTLIVPERILYAPRYKSICFHPSLLPRHRGASGINWAIIPGDAETGVTWFWPDKGIDTGPILIQKRVPIARERHRRLDLLQHALPDGHRRDDRGGRSDQIRQRARDRAGREQGDLRAAMPRRAREDRFRKTGARSLQPDSRMRSAARRLREPRRETRCGCTKLAFSAASRMRAAGHDSGDRCGRNEDRARGRQRSRSSARESIRIRRRSRRRSWPRPEK